MKNKFIKNILSKRLLLIDLLFIIFAFFYYLFFVNRGLVLGDEGYYVHLSERVLNGQILYKDFVLQYTPGYFFFLALMYKIFGVQILVSRFVSLFFCILILISVLFLFRLYKINSVKIHILISLVIISLGYPLLHIPIIAWPVVFFTVLLEIIFIFWHRSKRLLYIVLLGFLLALTFFFKQTTGAVFILVVNTILFFSGSKGLLNKFKLLFVLNSVWIFITAIWFYLLFINTHNLSGLIGIYEINKKFITTFPFSYPPLTYLLQPTGIFKLLPYYFPVIFLIAVIRRLFINKFDWEKMSFAILALGGFFVTIYPASDLLHVYPFLSLVIVSSIIFYNGERKSYLLFPIAVVFILVGFYLTFFTKSFRYDAYFLKETAPINLPRTKGILIDKDDPSSGNLVNVYTFISKNTKKNDYIFVYPFSPLLYTLLDRQNPSGLVQFVLLQTPDTVYPEEKVISEIKNKNARYIITAGEYRFGTKLSKFIQKQKQVLKAGPYNIFLVI